MAKNAKIAKASKANREVSDKIARKIAKKLKPDIKGALMEYLEPYDGSFGVMLSGGLDSHSVLFSLLELGHSDNITMYSIRLGDRESRDFKSARDTAKAFGLRFKPVVLPLDVDILKRDIVRNIKDIGTRTKVEVEAFWAIRRCIDQAKEHYMTGGLAADLFFCLSKTACMHFKDRADEYRIPKFEKIIGPTSQTSKLKVYMQKHGREWLSPWVSKRMLNEFKGTSWYDVNTPQQKMPVRVQFADYLEKCRIYTHTDMHGGDSGIKAHFDQLLDDPYWNAHGGSSVVGIYNRLIKGELKLKAPKGWEG